MIQLTDPPRRAPAWPPRKDGAAFGIWLRQALHDVFDESALMPMSPQLAALLEASRDEPDRGNQ